MGKFRGQAQPSTSIYRVCLNTALTWLRTQRRREARVVVVAPESVNATACVKIGPDRAEEKKDLMAVLMVAVRELPPGERSLVVLVLEGLSHGAMANITGMTENHAGVALPRVRKKLTRKSKGISNEI